MKTINIICIVLHILVGAGAVAGSMAAIANPYSPMGLDAAEVLRYSPFDSFLIPGIILFTVIGLGNLFAALSFIKKWMLRPIISGFFAAALAIWIFVQCVMLQTIAALHVIYFAIGAVQGLLALYLLYRMKVNQD